MPDEPTKRRPRRSFGFGLVSAALVLMVTGQALASSDEIEDLRGDIPTGDELRDDLGDIATERRELLADLNGAESALNETLTVRTGFSEDQQRLAVEIEAATASLRDVALNYFVSGGPIGDLGFLLSVEDAADLAWRQHLVRNHAGAAEVALVHLRELEARAGDDIKQSIEEAAALRETIFAIQGELDAVEPRAAEVAELLPLADAWDRAVIAIEEGSFGVAPIEKWEALRFCESTHNYGAISPSGTYRGAYQFDVKTWETVGGSGDPAAASPAEQDARGRELYARRGHQPWPKCGRFLE